METPPRINVNAMNTILNALLVGITVVVLIFAGIFWLADLKSDVQHLQNDVSTLHEDVDDIKATQQLILEQLIANGNAKSTVAK